MIGRILILSFGLFSLSCGSLSSNRQPQPKEKDVSVMARKGFETQPRRRVMVLPFLDAQATRSQKVGEEARRTLLAALNKTDRFVFVAPADFPKDVNSFVVNGEYDLATMSKIAEGLGLAAILEGKVLDIKAKKIIDFQDSAIDSFTDSEL
ncbi:MAG: hypothetical protein ABL958_20130, partial [Bdellovibrionia bacterium]